MRQIITTCICLMGSAICLADTWTVDDDGKADFSSIQDAIDVSSNGDFIYVQAGVYYEVIDYLGKAITVEGVDAQKTIIDGSTNQNAVVTFENNETNQSVLSQFTVRGGLGNFWSDPIFGQQRCGGGIFCDGASPTVQLCVITDNAAWGGAGIFVTQADPFIMFSQIVHNEATGHGGGMYLIDSVNAMIDSCDVNNNVASWGGGITCTVSSDPTILNCSFNENTTYNVGGGIFIRSSSSPSILSCEFNGNVQISNPLGSGGGACIYGSGDGGGPCYPEFVYCEFVGNVVLGDGGGMSAAYDSHPKLTTCTFVGNDAGRSGGGLACVADPDHLYPSNADVLDVTFEFNHADEEGGGVHVRYSDPIFESVEVSENNAGNIGGGINFFDSPLSQLLGSTICANTPNQTEGAFTDGGNNSINDTCSSCLGDVNEDGVVNVTDILAIINAWAASDPNADVNGDGVVNVTDLLLVVSAWGPC